MFLRDDLKRHCIDLTLNSLLYCMAWYKTCPSRDLCFQENVLKLQKGTLNHEHWV